MCARRSSAGQAAGTDRHRRRARKHLQAGNDAALPRARRGRQTRPDGRDPGRPGLGDTVARIVAERPAGRYTLTSMPSRVGGRPMPRVDLIDLRHEKIASGCLSEPLRRAMTDALEKGGQVILLLNRRGYHTFAICPRCGAVVKCDACDVAMTYHKKRAYSDMPHVRCRARLPSGVPALPRTEAILRRHWNRAARARNPDSLSRLPRAAHGF